MLWVNAQAALYLAVGAAAFVLHGNRRGKFAPLGNRVEHQMVNKGEQLGHFAPVPSCGKGVHLTAKIFARKACFVHRACACTPQGAMPLAA